MSINNVHMTEEEQVEALKKWWKDNGTSIIAGIVIGLGGIFGWRAYNDHQVTTAQQAAESWAQFSNSSLAADESTTSAQAARMRKEFADTPYAVLVAFAQAKQAVEAGDYAKAETELQWVLANSENVQLKAVAQIRLARLSLAQGNAEATLSQLEGDLISYSAAVEELRGDAMAALGRNSDARKAYAKALLAGARDKDGVQMKMDALGEESAS